MDLNFLESLYFNVISNYWGTFAIYIPIGVIGMWRWSIWVFKEIVALFYRPETKPFSATVSIVTPVYNEEPQLFTNALNSWRQNNPNEIIAVIDYSDTTCIEIFKQFAAEFKNAVLIVTEKPGKRPALADGILAAKSEIVALVDSDTLWEENTLRFGLSPFNDPKVAGVATRQNVLHTKTLAQKIFDIQLDLRYFDDYPFLSAAGDALVCLSGRTAFYRRQVVLPMIDDLVNETFLGKPVISGDDKRLTYLVLGAGWKVAYQSNSRVYTPGMASMSAYMKQRLRWTRNALRADLKAIAEGWVWKHPALAFFQIDKVIQSFALLLSPVYFFTSLYLGLWAPAIVIFLWWFVSRTLKLSPHLRRKPLHITIIPIFVFYTFLSAMMKLYAMFTLNTQGWITRWDTSRLPQIKLLKSMPAYASTSLVFVFLILGVYLLKQNALAFQERKDLSWASSLIQVSNMALDTNKVLGATTSKGDSHVTIHTVAPGDTLSKIAATYDASAKDLYALNPQLFPNINYLDPGLTIAVPRQELGITIDKVYKSNIQRLPKPEIAYDEAANTIHIYGRGTQTTLRDVNKALQNKYVTETAPGEWYLAANILVHTGATLQITNEEVTWLKIASDRDKTIWVKSYSGVLNFKGVKVTSWDMYANNYDQDISDGRGFIIAKLSSQMNVVDSEIAYLGYHFPPKSPTSEASTYGISWKLPEGTRQQYFLTGEVKNSKFHHNYFGAYTFGAVGMKWENNEFYDNIQYGLDPHDDSNGFLVKNNKFYHNGNHGLIFSKRCIENTIVDNIAYGNKLHGIMLHELSDHNIIENNTVYENKDGIVINNSNNNIIKNNNVTGNERGFRANLKSENNVIESNNLSNNTYFGITLYDEAQYNKVIGNTLVNNLNAIYLKTKANEFENNQIKNNKVGIYILSQSADNKLQNNTITDNTIYGIYTKTNKDHRNYLGTNTFANNRKDIVGYTEGDENGELSTAQTPIFSMATTAKN